MQSPKKCAIIGWFGCPSNNHAPLAQMDRAQASDAWCRRFESAMVRQQNGTPLVGVPFCSCILVSMRKRTQKIPFSADETRIALFQSIRSPPPRAEVRFSGRHGAPEKSTAQRVPAIEQYNHTNRKRIENFYVLYPFFLTSTAFVDANTPLVISDKARHRSPL